MGLPKKFFNFQGRGKGLHFMAVPNKISLRPFPNGGRILFISKKGPWYFFPGDFKKLWGGDSPFVEFLH